MQVEGWRRREKESWEESWVEGRSGRKGNDPAKRGLEWREVSGVITATRLMHTERAHPTPPTPTPTPGVNQVQTHTQLFSFLDRAAYTLEMFARENPSRSAVS